MKKSVLILIICGICVPKISSANECGIELPSYATAYGIDSNEYNQSMSVVNDSVSYLQYAQVGSWIDRYKVYMALDQDSLLLNSDPSLQTYYDTVQSSIMGDILHAERMLQTLYDSTTDSSNYATRYADAVNANDAIANGETWEMNEKMVNDVWLYLSHSPLDSVDSNVVYAIQTLASSCPFVEGLAVYKARSLWAMWEPNALFDDRVICAQGQNKNDDYTNIDAYILSNLKELTSVRSNNDAKLIGVNNSFKQKEKANEEAMAKLYPNPASRQVIIEYRSNVDGQFLLYNSVGEIVIRTTLSKDNTKTQLIMNDIANGIYHYEIEFANMKKTIGKLNVLK